MQALAICQFLQFFCLHLLIIYLTSYSSTYKVLLGMDNSSDTVLAKKVAIRLEIICRFDRRSSHLSILGNENYTI